MRGIMIVVGGALTSALLAAGCGGGSENTAPATTAAPATQTESAATNAATTEAATTTEDHSATTEEHGETTTEGEGGGGADVTGTVTVVGGEAEGGAQTIEASNGQKVRIVVRSDQTGDIHLHGYDIEKEAGPGKPAVFAFTADLEGIFEMESHVSEQVIAKLVVNP